MSKPLNLVGQVFSRLTVIERAENTKEGKTRWLCKCYCDEYTTVVGASLIKGVSTSCGCFHKENLSSMLQGNSQGYKHGCAKTNNRPSEYQTWCDMKQRCQNSNLANYHLYGGRGITVCASWDFFENFLIDMGRKPSPLHSLDRIDVNGNYEPSNCRWATAKEQSNNKRNSLARTLHANIS